MYVSFGCIISHCVWISESKIVMDYEVLFRQVIYCMLVICWFSLFFWSSYFVILWDLILVMCWLDWSMRMVEGVWFWTGSRRIVMVDRVKVVALCIWCVIAVVINDVEVPCVLIQIKSCKYVRVCIRLLAVELSWSYWSPICWRRGFS